MVGTNAYKVNDLIQGERMITVARNPKEELILTLGSTAGDVVINIASDDEMNFINTNVPIGTVITSFLDFDSFNRVTKNNEKSPLGVWSPKSYWAPCDGRNVIGSAYSILVNEEAVPDLRGIFLRGLNTFDHNEKTSVSENRKDPDDKRTLHCEVQLDALQDHKHLDSGHGHGSNAITSARIVTDNADGRDATGLPSAAKIDNGNAVIGGAAQLDEASGVPRTAGETRPKNIAVTFYIRIN